MTTLHKQNGIKISELVDYLQKQWLDKGYDGVVKVAIDTSAMITSPQAIQTGDGGVLLLAKTDNPCIDIYHKSENEPRYLCAETVEAIERMRKNK